jgi:hypothetical protein
VRSNDPIDDLEAVVRVRGLVKLAADPTAREHDSHCIACQVVRLIDRYDLQVAVAKQSDLPFSTKDEQITAPQVGRRITARFASRCAECRQPIAVGSDCIWSKGRCVHEECT